MERVLQADAHFQHIADTSRSAALTKGATEEVARAAREIAYATTRASKTPPPCKHKGTTPKADIKERKNDNNTSHHTKEQHQDTVLIS